MLGDVFHFNTKMITTNNQKIKSWNLEKFEKEDMDF